MTSAFITVDVDVQIEDRGNYWAASVPAFGLTVYSDTEELAQAKLEKSLKFYMTNFLGDDEDGIYKLRAYLDAQGVAHKMELQGSSSIRRQHSHSGYSVRRESRIALSGIS